MVEIARQHVGEAFMLLMKHSILIY